MDVQSLDIVNAILEPVVLGLTVFDIVIATSLFAMVIYFWLSTHLIDLYTRLVQKLHHRMPWIVGLLLLSLVALDLQYAEIGLFRYSVLLLVLTLFGFALRRLKVNAIPFLFSVILADRIIWLGIQYINIYF